MPEPRTMRFLDLAQDVLESEILPYLTAQDILQLQLTCQSLKQLIQTSPFILQMFYHKVFPRDPIAQLSHWEPAMYKSRCEAKVHTWGSMNGGRLGYSLKDIPSSHISKVRFSTGVIHPTLVPGLDTDVIRDISAGGFSFQILDNNGRIYTTGMSYHQGHLGEPGPGTSDYNMFQVSNIMRRSNDINFFPPDIGRRGGVMNIIPGPNYGASATQGARPEPIPQTMTSSSPFVTPVDPHPSHDLKSSNKFLKREYTTKDALRFIAISSGRTHFIALDSMGELWSWDRSEFGVKLKFQNAHGKDLVKDMGCKILKIAAGWGYSAALLHNLGLIYWKTRDSLKEYDDEVIAHHTLVSETISTDYDNRVVDFIALENCIIYITYSGQIHKKQLDSTPAFPLTSFQNTLRSSSNNNDNNSSKFTKLTGSFQSFAVFSKNNSHVFTGTNKVQSTTVPEIISEIQGGNCIDLQFGDFHKLALLKNGTLLSWGKQLDNCGCLGLGTNDHLVESGKARILEGHNGISLEVTTPTLVELGKGKKVVGIACAGWQSSAIII